MGFNLYGKHPVADLGSLQERMSRKSYYSNQEQNDLFNSKSTHQNVQGGRKVKLAPLNLMDFEAGILNNTKELMRKESMALMQEMKKTKKNVKEALF